MDLFAIFEEGPGFPFFMPNGMIIRNELESFWKSEHRKRGYEEIKTPLIMNEQLWRTSGHWDHYKDNMYFTKIDGEDYAIKPMNCPGSLLAYKRKMWSYRDFPIRMRRTGTGSQTRAFRSTPRPYESKNFHTGRRTYIYAS